MSKNKGILQLSKKLQSLVNSNKCRKISIFRNWKICENTWNLTHNTPVIYRRNIQKMRLPEIDLGAFRMTSSSRLIQSCSASSDSKPTILIHRCMSLRGWGDNILKLGDFVPKFKMKIVILSCLCYNYFKVGCLCTQV